MKLQHLPLEILYQIIDFIIPIFSLNNILRKHSPNSSTHEIDCNIIYVLESRFYPLLTNYVKNNNTIESVETIYDRLKSQQMRDVVSLYRSCAGFYRILSQRNAKRFWKLLSIYALKVKIEIKFMSKLDSKFETLQHTITQQFKTIPFEKFNYYISLFEEDTQQLVKK